MKYEIRISYIVNALIKTNRYEQYYLDKKLYQLFSYYEDEITYLDHLVLTPVYDVDEVLHRSVKLPTVNEINEKGVLKGYISQLNDPDTKEALLQTLQNGAMLNQMKRYLFNLELEEEYNSYRYLLFRNKAIEWCESNAIDYIIDK